MCSGISLRICNSEAKAGLQGYFSSNVGLTHARPWLPCPAMQKTKNKRHMHTSEHAVSLSINAELRNNIKYDSDDVRIGNSPFSYGESLSLFGKKYLS